jgi:hypothetical protein
MMLSLELTGLTCLNDSVVIDSVSTSSQEGLSETTPQVFDASPVSNGDHCPCHSLFSKMSQLEAHSSELSAFLNGPPSPKVVLTRAHFLFRPPILL